MMMKRAATPRDKFDVAAIARKLGADPNAPPRPYSTEEKAADEARWRADDEADIKFAETRQRIANAFRKR